ncbi:MAG: hypothetical protein ACXADC_06975 [Candidatus Thorarchaeota archaeon]
MLLIYASAGAFSLALMFYLYGRLTEGGHGKNRGRSTSTTNDVWMLGLLSCDFGPSPYTNGPARSLPFPKKSEKLAVRSESNG